MRWPLQLEIAAKGEADRWARWWRLLWCDFFHQLVFYPGSDAISNRSFRAFTVHTLTVALMATISTAGQAAASHFPFKRSGMQAKHIILMVGDGMNIEHEIATSRYLFGNDFKLSFHAFPYQGNQATWDVSTYKYWSGGSYDPSAIRPVVGYDPAKGGALPYPLGPQLPGSQAYHTAKATDSASAATAWASGYKTDDGNLNWLSGDPEVGGNRIGDGSVKNISEFLRERQDYAIGIVSTVPFTQATPAGFVSHNKSRYNYHDIGHQIIAQFQPEVVIGGGHPGTDNTPTFNYIAETDYLGLTTGVFDNEYVFVERQAGVDGGMSLLEAAQQAVTKGKKLFGLFGKEGDGNFESLRPNDLPATPLVSQATRENPTYSEATLAALKVLSQDKDGFFLMAEQGDIDWANHTNDFARMVGTIKDLHDGVQAVVDFVNQPNDHIDWTNTLLIVTADHSNSYMRNMRALGAGDLPEQIAKTAGSPQTPSCFVANCYPAGEVSFASADHTNELTRIYAKGAGTHLFRRYEGSWYPGTKILDNTQLFQVMMAAAGLPQKSRMQISRTPRR